MDAGSAGFAAIAAYGDIVQGISEKTVALRRGDEHSHEVPNYLLRALQIGKSLGWNKDPVLRVRKLVSDLRLAAPVVGNVGSFLRFAGLDLDYSISDPAVIAMEAENIATTADLDARHRVLHCAARAHRSAKKQIDRERCLLQAAETLVLVTDNNTAPQAGCRFA